MKLTVSLVTIAGGSWRYSQIVVVLRVKLVFAIVDLLFDQGAVPAHIRERAAEAMQKSLACRKGSPARRHDCALEGPH